MTVLVIQEWEGTLDEYDQVGEKLDTENNPPEGMILHSGADIGGGRLKAVDVWESEAAYQKWVQEKLIPAIAEVNPDAPQADIQVHELHDLVKP